MLRVFEPHVLDKMCSFSGQSLCNAAWAVAVAGDLGGSATGRGALAEVLIAAAARQEVKSFTDGGLRQLHQLVWEMRCGGGSGGRFAKVDERMMARCPRLLSAVNAA